MSTKPKIRDEGSDPGGQLPRGRHGVEVLAADQQAVVRRDASLRHFAEFVDAGRNHSSIELPGITSIAIVGGINELL